MSRTKPLRNGNGGKCEVNVWTRAITANSEWPDKVNITFNDIFFEFRERFLRREKGKNLSFPFECYYFFSLRLGLQEEFLDVIYWARQAIGIIVGIGWGLIPLKGFLALLL